MCSFKLQVHQNPFSAGAPNFAGKLTMLPRPSTLRTLKASRGRVSYGEGCPPPQQSSPHMIPFPLDTFECLFSTPQFLGTPIKIRGYTCVVRE